MARKEDAKRKTRRKLTLSKETIRDLTPKKHNADVVRGGIVGRGGNCSQPLSGC